MTKDKVPFTTPAVLGTGLLHGAEASTAGPVPTIPVIVPERCQTRRSEAGLGLLERTGNEEKGKEDSMPFLRSFLVVPGKLPEGPTQSTPNS